MDGEAAMPLTRGRASLASPFTRLDESGVADFGGREVEPAPSDGMMGKPFPDRI